VIPAPIPENENSRLAELRRLALPDSEREKCFDRLTQIAARVFNVPIAWISLVDENRQWIKSCVGTDKYMASIEHGDLTVPANIDSPQRGDEGCHPFISISAGAVFISFGPEYRKPADQERNRLYQPVAHL
jgi:hypothetical protein